MFLSCPGTCSSAVQRAFGKACRAAEESGRVTARGDKSLCLLFLRTGGLPHTLHHSSADLRLTQVDPHGGRRSGISPVRRCHTVVISRPDLRTKLPLWVTHRVYTLPHKLSRSLYLHLSQAHRVCLQKKSVCLRLLYHSHIVLHG